MIGSLKRAAVVAAISIGSLAGAAAFAASSQASSTARASAPAGNTGTPAYTGVSGAGAYRGAYGAAVTQKAQRQQKNPNLLSSGARTGQILYQETCSSCHGVYAQGSTIAPPLQGLGAATIDLWVGSGWMPLATPTKQPIRKPDKFTPQQTTDLANYIQTLGGGPKIPAPDLKGANLTTGASMFAESCAACHTITGAGDALSGGYEAPSLHGLSAATVEEAIITAPGDMPHFYPGELTKQQMLDVVAYVTQVIQHPSNPGGLALGGVGPVAEGFIGLFVGVGAALLFAMWIGDRSEGDEKEAVEDAHV